MPIVLFRIDERLIHGQVVVGWGERVNMDRIIVVDDELSQSTWEQELYVLGVPPTVDARFVDVEEARRSVADWMEDSRRVVVLLRDVETLERLADGGALGRTEINLGGLHHAEGREAALPYLYLSHDDRERLRRVAAQGVSIAARDLPASRAVPLDELIGPG